MKYKKWIIGVALLVALVVIVPFVLKWIIQILIAVVCIVVTIFLVRYILSKMKGIV